MTMSTTSPSERFRKSAGVRARFSRADLTRGALTVLSAGRYANAVLYRFEHHGTAWVVKDFRPQGFLSRELIGRFLVHREFEALKRVEGLPATPQDAFLIDEHALAYRYVPGCTLSSTADVTKEFFLKLELSLREMHAHAQVVHLDLRSAKNILITEAGEPMILDFQSAVCTAWMPERLRRFAERVDLAAIYKHWKRRSPETMGAERIEALARMNRIRPLWALRPYDSARDR